MGVAVAADTEDIANQALKLVEIEWEERPFNLDQEEALKPGAPSDKPGILPRWQLRSPASCTRSQGYAGRSGEGFREADRTIELGMRRDQETLGGAGAAHAACSGGTGNTPRSGSSTSARISPSARLAEFFKVPVSQVTVHCLYQGGSFGGWSQMAFNMQPNIIAGILSKRTGRPVKWQFSQKRGFLRRRHG